MSSAENWLQILDSIRVAIANWRILAAVSVTCGLALWLNFVPSEVVWLVKISGLLAASGALINAIAFGVTKLQIVRRRSRVFTHFDKLNEDEILLIAEYLEQGVLTIERSPAYNAPRLLVRKGILVVAVASKDSRDVAYEMPERVYQKLENNRSIVLQMAGSIKMNRERNRQLQAQADEKQREEFETRLFGQPRWRP